MSNQPEITLATIKPGREGWVYLVHAEGTNRYKIGRGRQMTFCVRFYGLNGVRSYAVPAHLNQLLELADTPEQIEFLISEYECQLAQLDNECNDFLVCDTTVELMADVLRSKGIGYQIICGVNDEGDSHSYIQIGEKRYDPTYQGFGAATASEAGTVGGEE